MSFEILKGFFICWKYFENENTEFFFTAGFWNSFKLAGSIFYSLLKSWSVHLTLQNSDKKVQCQSKHKINSINLHHFDRPHLKNKDSTIITIRIEIIIQYRTILTRRLTFMWHWIFDKFMTFISASIDAVKARVLQYSPNFRLWSSA